MKNDKSKETVLPMTQGQLKDIIATMVGSIPNLTSAEAQNIIGGKRKFVDGIKQVFSQFAVNPQAKFKVFKTLKLGTGPKTADDFRQTIKDKGMLIGDWANDILGKPQFAAATEETEVDLVVVSVAELGFKNGARRKDIYARAKELGLPLCPNEVGPHLRLQYADQPNHEWLVIGMEPIAGSDGGFKLFIVERNDRGRWLGGGCGRPDLVWPGRWRFVFVLPRK